MIIDFFATAPMRAEAALIRQSIVTEPMQSSAFVFVATGQGTRRQAVERLIGGAWLPSDAARIMTVFDPVTDEPVTTLPVASKPRPVDHEVTVAKRQISSSNFMINGTRAVSKG